MHAPTHAHTHTNTGYTYTNLLNPDEWMVQLIILYMSWLTIAIYQSSVSGMNRSYIEKGLEIPCQYLGDLSCL